jgi:hypothetical protein
MSSSLSRPAMPSRGTKPTLHFGDIFHQHGHAVLLVRTTFSMSPPCSPGQIIIAAVVNQADAADVDGLLADA